MNTIRLFVDVAFNCRAKKGDRKLKDGRLVKAEIYFGATVKECLAEARKTFKAGEKMAPGYAEVVKVHAYKEAEFRAAPSTTDPIYSAASL